MLSQEEEERHTRDPCQFGCQAGAQLTGFVELQSEKETGFGLELPRFLLKGPQNFRRIGDLVIHSMGERTYITSALDSV